MKFNDEDRNRFERFCPSIQQQKQFNFDLNHQKRNSVDNGSIQFIPIPVPVFSSSDEDEEDDEDDDDPYNPNSNRGDRVKEGLNGKLNKFDKGSRSWLSSGTMFLLIIIFHIIQIRSDIRKFVEATDIQLKEACSIMEDKTSSLQTALGLAAQDIGPISFKFIRDLKTKIRSAFLFAGQILGGRVREAMASLMKQYYCLFIGIVVTFKSLIDNVIQVVTESFSKDSFAKDILVFIQKIIDDISHFLTEPEKAFSDLFGVLFDAISEAVLKEIKIPEILSENSSEACSNLREFDFEKLHNLVRKYIAALISAMAVLLVIYNAIQFISALERHESESAKLVKLKRTTLEQSNLKKEISHEKSGSIVNAFKWMFNFLSFQPFWVFLSMGIFGLLHVRFSYALEKCANDIKTQNVEPAIEFLKDKFTLNVKNYIVTVETGWANKFQLLLAPVTLLIESLANKFKPVLEVIVNVGTKILKTIDNVIDWFDANSVLTVIGKTLHVILDCLILRNFQIWIVTSGIIQNRLFNKDKLMSFKGGIVGMLRKSIESIFRKLEMTKYLQKMFTSNFLSFLHMMAKRSVFLYVYLFVCLIFLFQGIFILLIKLILGHF